MNPTNWLSLVVIAVSAFVLFFLLMMFTMTKECKRCHKRQMFVMESGLCVYCYFKSRGLI